MRPSVLRAAVLASLVLAGRATAQADRVFLRPEAGGPMGVITSVAFSPDGTRLYVAGLDKVVRVWTLENGQFRLNRTSYRVPVGPGFSGAINAIAVSPDGRWLAVGGIGVAAGRGDVRSVGMAFPSAGKSPEKLEDEGTIFVFHTTNEREIRALRGHRGDIRGLAFVSSRDDQPRQLVSAAEETVAGAKPAGRVRLWDLETRASLADQTIEKANTALPPGLTAWRTGGGPRETRVAVAWGDSALRIWDVGANRITPIEDGQHSSTLSRAAANGEFWSGSYDNPSGSGLISRWLPGQAAPAAQVRIQPADRNRGPFTIPREIATFSSRSGGPIDRAAVLARRQGAERAATDQDVLLFIDLERQQVMDNPRLLGLSEAHLRRIAVSPTGTHVAVADTDGQQVRVFATADLIAKGNGAEATTLRSAGANFTKVAFRRKGDAPGLALENAAGERLVFDFNGRQLLPDEAAWQADKPNIADWSVKPVGPGGRLVIAVAGPGQPERLVTVAERGTLLAGALVPPRPPATAGPQIVVAWLDERMQPALAVFDVPTGAIVRHLSGHTAAIRSLSVSGDGRLLASAAEDQTVCLWSLRSLDQVIGKVGSVPGLKLRTQNNRAIVVDSPAALGIPAGAVVESLTVNGQAKSPAAASDFYTTIWQSKPGTEATIRVRAGEMAPRDVKVTLAQGADERKPLLSLFVTRTGPVNRRDWIAWTSMGPYDSSSPKAEEYLGWHFNPDKPHDGEPVLFARADKYRDAFQKPGILQHVIRRANTLDALKDYEAKPPVMGVMLDGIDPAAPTVVGRPLARDRKLAVRATVDAPFPLDRISALRWRLDDGPWRPFAAPDNRTWSADLAPLTWGRGPHQVQVQLTTDSQSRKYESLALFQFAPAAPRIEFAPAWLAARGFTADGPVLRAATKIAEFVLEANVIPGAEDERPVAEVRLNGDLIPGDGLPLSRKLTLREGDNAIEIRATNAGASKDLRHLETDVRTLRVHYSRVTAPPRIELQVVAAPGGRDARTRAADGTVLVHHGRQHIVGTVITEDDDPVIERNGRRIALSRGETPLRYRFEDDITLDKPGETSLAYTGQTRRSPKTEERLVLKYQPLLPLPGAVEPGEVDVFSANIELKVELEPAGNAYDCSAEIVVNGEARQSLRVPAGSRELRVPVILRPGANSVAIRLHNEWGESLARQIEFRYRRPPVVEEISAPATATEAVVAIAALVQSPADLQPTSATVNGRLFDRDRFSARALGGDRWSVAIAGVPLGEGVNDLVVGVANEDGESRTPRSVRLRYDKPLPPKPDVRFVGLPDRSEVNVRTEQYKLQMQVQSTTDLRRVEVRTSDHRFPFMWTAGDKPFQPEPVEIKVPYGGRTTVTLTAVNAGGEASTEITLQRPQSAAYVKIESLRDLSTGELLQALPQAPNAPLAFDSAQQGRLEISGRVIFDPQDPTSRSATTVRVRANSFQQIPVSTKPINEHESQFTARILLTSAENNEIIVDLPALPTADGSGDRCTVNRCLNPMLGRRLHLVVVGFGARDAQELRDRALRAIQAKNVNEGTGKREKWEALPSFQEVLPSKPLVGYVDKNDIRKKLQEVARDIRTFADQPSSTLSDVVLLCYLGREVINEHGHFLWTSDSRLTNVHLYGLSCQNIIREFENTGGAQVLLLDVERIDSSPRQVAQTFSSTRLGVLHAAWTGSGPPPKGLLTLVEENWDKANRLRPFAEQLLVQQKSNAPQLQIYPYIADQLAQLEFGSKPESRR